MNVDAQSLAVWLVIVFGVVVVIVDQ